MRIGLYIAILMRTYIAMIDNDNIKTCEIHVDILVLVQVQFEAIEYSGQFER